MPPRGYKHTDEARAKMLGRTLTDEHKAKIGAAQRGKKLSAEHKAGIAASNRRRYEDPAEREKTSAERRRYWEDPANREKQSEARRHYFADPANREKNAEAQRRRYEDPAEREKCAQRGELNPNWGQTPSAETRAKQSEAMSGELSSGWLRDDVGYSGAHVRLPGPFFDGPCVYGDQSCSKWIVWGLRHDTPDEFVKISKEGRPYSVRPEDYVRICRSHYTRNDYRGPARPTGHVEKAEEEMGKV